MPAEDRPTRARVARFPSARPAAPTEEAIIITDRPDTVPSETIDAAHTGEPPEAEVRRETQGALPWLLGITAAGVLLQALLAGLFLSGVGQARLAHTIVGWLLPYFALAPAVVAVLRYRNRRLGTASTIAIAGLPVLLYAQEVLGHMPFPTTTAVHVPLGAALLAYATVLAWRMGLGDPQPRR